MGNGPGNKKKHLDGLSGSWFMLKIKLGEILKNTKIGLISPFLPFKSICLVVLVFGCFYGSLDRWETVLEARKSTWMASQGRGLC